MNELLVIKSPQFLHRSSTGFRFYADEIVGVVDNHRTITKNGYTPSADDYEDSINLIEGQPQRIIEAFERTAAATPEMKEYVNCHMFVFFALGRAKSLKQHEYYPGIPQARTQYDALDAGAPYSTVLPNGTINHSLLGTGVSNESISVLGDNGIYASMKNETLAGLYEANKIVAMRLEDIDE